MLRFIGLTVLLAAGFAGGFYFGVRHRNDQLIQHPEELIKAYQEAIKNTAADKAEKIKKVLLEE